MLVLSRREGEKIIIGDSIVITVVRGGTDKVRIGIDAPENVRILRSELEVHDDGHRASKQDVDSQQSISKPAA